VEIKWCGTRAMPCQGTDRGGHETASDTSAARRSFRQRIHALRLPYRSHGHMHGMVGCPAMPEWTQWPRVADLHQSFLGL
jgi:hypothetical protein